MKLCSLRFCSINLLLVFALLSLTLSAQAQTTGWQYVQGGGGGGFPGSTSSNPAPDYAYGSAVDKDDNLIVGGVTSWNSQFDTVQFGNNTNWQNGNFFLTKYDKCGNVLWARVGGGDSNDYIQGLDVDEAGNIYVIGALNSSGNPCYINTPLKDTILYNCTRFFAKFDNNGNLTYVKTYTGNASLQAGMFKRLSNGLFLCIANKGTPATTFDNFPIQANSHNFLLLNSLGNVLKMATIDTALNYNVNFCDFEVDEHDNIYFSLFNTTVSDLKVLSSTYNPAPQNTYLLIKTDTSFLVKDANLSGYNQETLYQLSYSDGYIYGAGKNVDGAIFDNDTTHYTPNPFFGRISACKIDTNLNLVWMSRNTVQNSNPQYTVIIPGASKDNLYLGFQHRGNLVWDSASLSSPANTSRIAILRLRTSDGVCVSGQLATGGNNSKDKVDFIHTGSKGDANLIGSYANYIGIPGDSIYAQGGVNSPDFFILKWGLPCSDTVNSLDRPDAPSNLVATGTGTQTTQVT